MSELKKEEMKKIQGGTAVSVSSALNAVAKIVSTIFSMGQAVGSAIRRARAGSYCSY